MSSYSRSFLILCLLLLSSAGCANQPEMKKTDPQVDLYILLALDSERNLQYQESLEYYQKLYNIQEKKTYLKKLIEYSFKTKNYTKMEQYTKIALDKYPKEKEYFWHQLIISLFSQKRKQEAILEGKKLILEFQTPQSYELLGNLYFTSKQYKEALQYYESAYTLDQNEKTVLQLTNILYSYLDKKSVALAYLETYLQTKGCSVQICDKLMLIYQEQGNIDGMLSILNRMHTKYKNNPELQKTILYIQNLIVSLLEKKDIKKAIQYLEESQIDQTKLINLYYQDRQLHKALDITKKLYKKTRNPELLGKIAMFRFELATDKRKVMPTVIANFELALGSGINDASYQNYYGYILIDFDIDVPKGVELVQKALKTSPNNIAYLDSLAWGYYKLQKCEEAYKIMSKVVVTVGLSDPEIKDHWEKIKKCVKEK